MAGATAVRVPNPVGTACECVNDYARARKLGYASYILHFHLLSLRLFHLEASMDDDGDDDDASVKARVPEQWCLLVLIRW